MILGTDITSVAEWEVRLRRTPRTAQLAFSPAELRASGGDLAFLARAWALKESVAKAFGTGFEGIGWRAIELLAVDARALTVRAAFGSTACDESATGWRADIVADGDLVVAAVVASRAPVKLSSRLLSPEHCSSERSERSAQLSRAARAAARCAARDVLGPGPMLDWGRSHRGAPLLSCRQGRPALSVSWAHGGGTAVALVGVAGEGADREPDGAFAGEPVVVDLELDDEVLRGVRAAWPIVRTTSPAGLPERGADGGGRSGIRLDQSPQHVE